jgi:hypothetical protein
MVGLQSSEPFHIEAGDEMCNGIATCPPCQLGGENFGMAIRHGQHFFGVDHLISRHCQRTAVLESVQTCPNGFAWVSKATH